MNKKIKSSYLSFTMCNSSLILPILFAHQVADLAHLDRSRNEYSYMVVNLTYTLRF